MSMYVLEAKNANDKTVGRAEYDSPSVRAEYVKYFKARPYVSSITIRDEDSEIFSWERS